MIRADNEYLFIEKNLVIFRGAGKSREMYLRHQTRISSLENQTDFHEA